MSSQTHYDLLQVPPSASLKTIQRAYYQLARQVHPDKNNNTSVDKAVNISTISFCDLQQAWERLQTDRAGYDQELQRQQKRTVKDATRLTIPECRPEITMEQNEEWVEYWYTCRCGTEFSTCSVENEDNGTITILACPGCSLWYDTSLIWNDEMDNNDDGNNSKEEDTNNDE